MCLHSQGRGPSAIPEADVPEGNGSGIIWDKQGHVSTVTVVDIDVVQQLVEMDSCCTAAVATHKQGKSDAGP